MNKRYETTAQKCVDAFSSMSKMWRMQNRNLRDCIAEEITRHSRMGYKKKGDSSGVGDVAAGTNNLPESSVFKSEAFL